MTAMPTKQVGKQDNHPEPDHKAYAPSTLEISNIFTKISPTLNEPSIKNIHQHLTNTQHLTPARPRGRLSLDHSRSGTDTLSRTLGGRSKS